MGSPFSRARVMMAALAAAVQGFEAEGRRGIQMAFQRCGRPSGAL